MTDRNEQPLAPEAGVVENEVTQTGPQLPEVLAVSAEPVEENQSPVAVEATASPAEAEPAVAAEATEPEAADGVSEESRRWHAEAGRKGARRIHELIEAGKLYEREHGLKRGRQRLRQLIELGKLYEQEHGLQPAPRKRRRSARLSPAGREEVLATLLECLLRIAKPSFRAELTRLVEALQGVEQAPDEQAHAA